jgi:hypothetical protein
VRAAGQARRARPSSMGAIPRLSPHTPLHTHATQQDDGTTIRVIASEAKQSIYPSVALWIASLRSQ